jgi:N-formylmaleamate deformylase
MHTSPALTAEVNGVTVSYRRTGHGGAPTMFLHGLMGDGATWRPVTRLLEADLDVITPDARGHGRSSAPASGYRYSDLAADVKSLTHHMGLGRLLLVGHSMGGMTAALAATEMGQRLRGLVLVDPTFLSDTRQQEVFDSDVVGQHRQALDRGRSVLLEDALARQAHRSSEVVELQVEARLRTSLAAFEVLRPPNPPYRELVTTWDVPTLLVIGDKPVVTLDTAMELCDLNPRLRVEQIAGAGHGLPFDQPEQLAKSILAFARDLSGSP